jgi:hypothetical protein
MSQRAGRNDLRGYFKNRTEVQAVTRIGCTMCAGRARQICSLRRSEEWSLYSGTVHRLKHKTLVHASLVRTTRGRSPPDWMDGGETVDVRGQVPSFNLPYKFALRDGELQGRRPGTTLLAQRLTMPKRGDGARGADEEVAHRVSKARHTPARCGYDTNAGKSGIRRAAI